VIFNNSYSPTHSIVTDTLNTYPVNDSSVFYAVYGPPVFDYLGGYFPFQIEFDHRFNTDSLSDFGFIKISVDGGNTWINGLSNEFIYNYDTPLDNSHVFENTGTTLYDSLTVTGNSNGWIHSRITKDVYGWILSHGYNPIDSIIVKFTFQSDSIENYKDGWQIDNLCLNYLVGPISVNENKVKYFFNVYPNPFNSFTNIELQTEPNKSFLSLYNVFGQNVKTINIVCSKLIIDRGNLPSGLYFLQFTQDNKVITTKKLIIID